MKPFFAWAAAILVALAAGVALFVNRPPRADESTPPAAGPVALVHSELPRERRLVETLNEFGDVAAGPLTALSFARAGQITYLRAVVGDRVARGTTLATQSLDPAARETYAQASNALSLARREADRQRQLLTLQLATQAQVDAADKAVQDASGTMKALDSTGGGTTSTSLTAPFDGIVAAVAAAQGDRVQPGAPVLQLARSDVLRIQVGIEPSDSRRVHVGTPAILMPVGAPGAAPVRIEAVVASVQDAVDPKTQLVSAIVTLPRTRDAPLVPGMKVRASLQVGTQTAVAVPRNAVLSDERGDYVFQIAAGKAQRRSVTRRLESEGYVAIEGLEDLAQPVVTVGNYELHDGMAVRESTQ